MLSCRSETLGAQLRSKLDTTIKGNVWSFFQLISVEFVHPCRQFWAKNAGFLRYLQNLFWFSDSVRGLFGHEQGRKTLFDSVFDVGKNPSQIRFDSSFLVIILWYFSDRFGVLSAGSGVYFQPQPQPQRLKQPCLFSVFRNSRDRRVLGKKR